MALKFVSPRETFADEVEILNGKSVSDSIYIKFLRNVLPFSRLSITLCTEKQVKPLVLQEI
jgi:hypothetical protein